MFPGLAFLEELRDSKVEQPHLAMAVTRMLAGFRSRWTTSLPWAYATAPDLREQVQPGLDVELTARQYSSIGRLPRTRAPGMAGHPLLARHRTAARCSDD